MGSVENVNSAIEQFTYIGDITHQKDRVALSLLGQMVQEPLFDQLRAKEQLGYIVRLFLPPLFFLDQDERRD